MYIYLCQAFRLLISAATIPICSKESTYVKHVPDFDFLQLTKKSFSKYIHLPKTFLD